MLAWIVRGPSGAWSETITLPIARRLRGVRLDTRARLIAPSRPFGVGFGDAWAITLGP